MTDEPAENSAEKFPLYVLAGHPDAPSQSLRWFETEEARYWFSQGLAAGDDFIDTFEYSFELQAFIGILVEYGLTLALPKLRAFDFK